MLCAEDRIDTGFFPYEPGSQCGLIHNDHLGTPQKMTDASGAVVWSADYKPFGEATMTVSTITNNLRFPGQYYDAETDTYYNYFRVYNPAIGRYVESDPVGIGQGKNHLYIYVNSNSINFTDPIGLWFPQIHEKLTRNALNRVNCSKAADKIVNLNVAVDKGDGQLPKNAFWHAMSNGEKNISNKVGDITAWQARVDKGKTSCDENTIGEATHALQDYFAPAHNFFKPWRDRWWEYIPHILSDGNESAESAMAENATGALLSGITERCPCLCK